jgi:hypothetical protein
VDSYPNGPTIGLWLGELFYLLLNYSISGQDNSDHGFVLLRLAVLTGSNSRSSSYLEGHQAHSEAFPVFDEPIQCKSE